MFLEKIAQQFLDLLYPASCHLCECHLSKGRYLCHACTDALRYLEAPFCNTCGEPYDGNIKTPFICPNCHDLTFDFEFARAALQSETDSRSLLHHFKYMRQIHLAGELARLMETALHDDRFAPYIQHGILVPVPLFWARQRKRRFNQAEEIGRKLSAQTSIPFYTPLKRTRNTQTQVGLSRTKRLENLHSAFRFKPRYKKIIQDKYVILIDDVFTTGSTANECSKALINAGAQKVAILTVLRG